LSIKYLFITSAASMGVVVAPFAPVMEAGKDGRSFPSTWSARCHKTFGSFLAFLRDKRLLSYLSLLTSRETSFWRLRYLLPVAESRILIASNVSRVR
jgi:hypothetical protein